MKTVTIPFDLEIAKKIQSGEVKGKIVDKIGIEYEIVKLTDALLKEGKAWNPEAKQIEDVKKESKPRHVFKPLDLCLAKFSDMELWTLVQFGYELNGSMVGVGGLTWNKWIPYEGNEHLLGTTKKPEE